MRRMFEIVLIASGLLTPVCRGQAFLDAVNFKASELTGIHLLGVSVYSGYSTSAYPFSGGYALNTSPSLSALGGDIGYGASASIGWQLHRDKTDATVVYTGTYGGMVRYSNLDAYSQSLSLSFSRALTPRLMFTLSGSGNDSTLTQYLFQPTPLGVTAQTPSSFDDLAAAFSAGQFTNAQIASALTGSPIIQAAGRSLLMGNRVLTYTGQAGLNYDLSQRLHMHFSSFTGAGQTRLGGQDNGPPVNLVMPRTLGANGGVGFSYDLSPRTDVGVDVEEARTINHYESVFSSTASAFVGRKMGMHWFMTLRAGGNYNVPTQQMQVLPKTRQMVGGGSLGFRAGMHTLVGSYDRSSSDTFGFAVGAITTMAGAWSWRRPGSSWGLFASYGEQQTRNTGFTSLSGWQGSAGLSRAVNDHSNVSLQYVYLSSAGTYAGVFNKFSVQSVRLSFGWSPQTYQHSN